MKKILTIAAVIIIISFFIFKTYKYIENKIITSFINLSLNESKNMQLVLNKIIFSKLFIEDLLINSLEITDTPFIFKDKKLINKIPNHIEIQQIYNNLIDKSNENILSDILKIDSIFYVYKLIKNNPDTLYLQKIEDPLLEEILDFNDFIIQYYKNSNFAYIAWQDENGIIAGAPDFLKLTKIKTDTFLYNIKTEKYRYSSFNNEKVIEFVLPFILKDSQIGILRIGFYTNYLDNLLKKTKVQFFSFFIILISFFIIIIVIINYITTKKEFYNLSNHTGIILQNIDDGILVLNEDFSVYFINKSLKTILETENNINQILNLEQILKQKKGEINLEINKQTKNILFNVRELITLDKKKQYIIIIKDITELKKLEYISRKKERMSLLGRISSMVAHEIRNPLNSIYIIIQRLHYEFEVKKAQEEYENLINIVYKEINRLNNIVTKFLEYGRLPQPQKKPFFIKELVEKLNIILSTWQSEKKFSYEINIQDNFQINGDEEQLYQAIFNIVKNAFQNIKPNGKIIVDIYKKDNYINIEMRNDGEKIPDHIKNKIFDLYFTTKEDGSGFGLPITKKIIEEHDGEINVYSTEKETKFIIKIPA